MAFEWEGVLSADVYDVAIIGGGCAVARDKTTPHIVRPMHFVLPHHAGLRRAWFILYDHLRGCQILPPTRSVDLTRDVAGDSLPLEFRVAAAPAA